MFVYKEIKKLSFIKHAFFSRNGGNSKSIYSSLNCGLSSKDNKKIIIENRKIALKKLGLQRKKLIVPNQIHSNIIKVVKNNTKIKKIKADGLLTVSNKLVLGILTADCAPVFLIDKKKKIICAMHVGWRGAKKNIINNGVKLMLEYGSKLNNIISCIGPCIGKDSYWVKYDFYKKFIYKNNKNKKFFSKINKDKSMKFNFNLYIRSKIKETGIKKNYYRSFDTYKDKKNFFSYRRSKENNELDYGRCMSIITLV